MNKEEYLLPGERIDDLQLKGLQIIQNPEWFCFGMDAVLLSGFVPAGAKGNLMDLGCGNGILPILLSAKTRCSTLTGLEIQGRVAQMAQRSVRMNGLEDRISILEGDIREAGRAFAPASFDIVTSNPPYMVKEHGLLTREGPRAAARHEIFCTFRDVALAARHLLKQKGHFYLVHRPFRLVEILLQLREADLEPKRLRMVHPFADKEPNMVLIDAVRDGRSGITVEPPLFVFDREGVFTPELREIYGS